MSRVKILDGSFALELEKLGFIADKHALWTAEALASCPEKVLDVHRRFLDAGAEVISTNTYHASLPNIEKELGLSPADAEHLVGNGVHLALQALEERGLTRESLLCSVGPFAVTRRDASEYTGAYIDDGGDIGEKFGMTKFLFETIPAAFEARCIVEVLRGSGVTALISFSCKDGEHLRYGSDKFVDAVETCLASPEIVGVGINCTPPQFVTPLLETIQHLPLDDKIIAVYPNLIEKYDLETQRWVFSPRPVSWEAAVRDWTRLGARLIGGCCLVGCEDLQEIAKVVHACPS